TCALKEPNGKVEIKGTLTFRIPEFLDELHFVTHDPQNMEVSPGQDWEEK
ncbi:2918_t:CDS:2, partial [Gigaspora rosea]